MPSSVSAARACGAGSDSVTISPACFAPRPSRPWRRSTAPPSAARYPDAAIEAIPGFTGRGSEEPEQLERTNTTIGCLVTNARLTKPEACRAADLAHTGIARAVEPPHTNFDGDALFLLATGEVETRADLVAALGAQAVATAIRAAVSN